PRWQPALAPRVMAPAEPLAPARCAPSTPALPASLELATLPSSSAAPSFPPLATTASFTSSVAPAWNAPLVAPPRTAPRPPPRFTVRVPRAEEEDTERQTWLGLLARLEEALTQLGLLEPDPSAELPLLASAGISGVETQSRAEYLLGQFGEVLAGHTLEQTHHPLGFSPSGPSAEQAEIDRLEAALSSATDPVETAKLQFDLARRLYSTDTTRALQLARSAQGTLREHNLADARELLSDVDDWLDDHGTRIRSRGL
ncbi:MAG: hypothetical protein M3Y59_01295, partial [Myxococcota bacterium]|nr:hypothetical protein [Myxococcota bacterium]